MYSMEVRFALPLLTGIFLQNLALEKYSSTRGARVPY